jgi:hypothetical protein
MSPTHVFVSILQSGLSASVSNSSGNNFMLSYLLADGKKGKEKAYLFPLVGVVYLAIVGCIVCE